MMRKYLLFVLFLLFGLSVCGYAQDEDYQSRVDYRVDKMKKELKLTDSQADAVAPIIKDYLVKHDTILQETAGQGIVDHTSIKNTLKALKEFEYQKLSKILSADQMKRWIDKENLMATLNPDSPESAVDDGTTLTAEGANFKF